MTACQRDRPAADGTDFRGQGGADGTRRGACSLVSGLSQEGRPLHIVCTTAQPLLILITVYEPKPPKWVTPRKRRNPP